ANQIEDEVFTFGKLGPYFLGMRRGGLHDGGTAYTRLITVLYREYLDPAYIIFFQAALGGADIGKLASFSRGHDHQLEVLGSQGVDAARKRSSYVEFRTAQLDGLVSAMDSLIRNPRQMAQ